MQNLGTIGKTILQDRIGVMAILIVFSFASVLFLESQSRASYVTYAILLVMLAYIRNWLDVFRLPLMIWSSLLVSWLASSTLWSEPFDLREAFSVWIRSLLILTFIVAIAECQLRGQLQRWMGLALTVVGALAVGAAISHFYETHPLDGRLNGLGQLDTHVIAALVYGVVLIFVIQTVASAQHKGIVVVGIATALLIAFAVYLSDSRNAWVSVLIGLGAYILTKITNDVRQFAAALLALVALMLVTMTTLLLNDSTREMLLPRGDSFRFDIWSTTWQQITTDDAWLFGRGITTADDIETSGTLFAHPHNIYLALVHQGGIIALLLYLGVLFQAFSTFAKQFETEDAKLGLGVLLMATSAHLLDGHELIDKIGDTWFLVWMPIGLALGLSWTTYNHESPELPAEWDNS